jgi:hypothetical protein
MKATYFLEERNRGWEDCTITKLSRKGMGVTFHTEEEIPPDSTLHLKVFTSNENEYFTVKGDLRWIEKAGRTFMGGLELREILDEPKWLQLIYFIKQEKEKKVKSIKNVTPNNKSKNGSPAPQRVVNVPPTPMEQIKSILNYKII